MHVRTLLVLTVAAALLAPGLALAAPDPRTKFDDHLERALAGDAGPSAVRVLVTTVGDEAPVADAARDLGAVVTWEYDIIDGFAATVPVSALDALAARDDVVGLWLDRPVTTLMDLSTRSIEADKSWAAGYRGAGITVAVIDTGIDPLHSFFTGAIVSCVSTIGGLVSPECTDSDGHGTHVAGTVASRDATHPGVAPSASLAVVRVLHAAGAGTSADIIAGMDWVRTNKDLVSPKIRVATMSIGFLNPGCGDDSSPEAQAANNLVSSGVFFSVAAGNSGHKSCTIDGASAASKVTTVAAVDEKSTSTQEDDVIASFSSGGSSKNNKPDVSFPGVDITSAFIGAGVLVATLDGTSMATPHAAGTAALLLSKEPALTATQVKDRITGTAVKTSNTGNTFNLVYGHGLGNACKALQLNTCGSVAPPPPAREVHVDAIAMSYAHGNKATQHVVTTTVKVVDAANAAVSGATVTLALKNEAGSVQSLSATTGADGVASFERRQNNGGHGTWEACVTGVSGTGLDYVASANRETCETLVVS